MAEYQVSFPAAHIDKADEIIKFLEGFSAWSNSSVARLPKESEFVVLGQAGVGKTHAICDIAVMRAARGLRSVVLFGERFSGNSEPWEQIRQQLGFDGSFGRDSMLAALDAAAEASGKPLLLSIDGLNETRPRTYWRGVLPSMIVHLRPYSSLKLCVSCRTTYESHVIPPKPTLIRFSHLGFQGMEFDACRSYFLHYGLEPLVSPVLQPEFTNPLFLRLVCEAMKAVGITQLPLGWLGIGAAINAFLAAKNKAYAAEHDLAENHRLPERGVKAFISAAESAKRSTLPWSEATRAVESVLPTAHSFGPLMDWLVREGLLITDADPNPTSQTTEDYVRIAFERLGDHLLAAKILDGIKDEEIELALASDGALGHFISSVDNIEENAGLVEALSIQMPERFGYELPDCAQTSELQRLLIERTVTAMPWRSPSTISTRCRELLWGALSLRGFSHAAFDVALSVSTQPSLANATWLHEILASNPMPSRDGFWCAYLHGNYEEHGPVEKLLRGAFTVEVGQVPVDTVERWATVLLWFCAASDRRIRDYSTKALVRLTEANPLIWVALIRRFIAVDDEYVVERCLAAAYGALLRNRGKAAEGRVAALVFNEVFKNSARFQNATIRDYARSILDLAAHDHVLASEIAEADYLPPYESDWPLKIPDEGDLGRYRSSDEFPKLAHSCLDDDFNKYTLGIVDRYDGTVNRAAMARWILQHVIDMGYGGKGFANYDGYMLYKYGGGRGRPKWAERIGKKYQWIALARLVARLADNARPTKDRWSPEPLRAPLVYERGRDLDPSLLVRESATKKTTAWWMREDYDFSRVTTLTDTQWVGRHDDMPSTEALLSEHDGIDGSNWIVLHAYPEWSEKTGEAAQSGKYRLIWLHIHSYLIPAHKASMRWRWFQKQQFFGRWMPEGPEFHEGFIGEYPWAASFNLYKDEYMSRGGSDSNKNPPVDAYPTCSSVYIGNEYDSYQTESITFLVPARRFFETDSLDWNGEAGYECASGHLCFLDPSVLEAGPPALLVEVGFLRRFLVKHHLALVWTVIGEKLIILDHRAPRLVYSRAHMLSSRGLLSSKPVVSLE